VPCTNGRNHSGMVGQPEVNPTSSKIVC
jgi:hypothetical protein